MTMDESSGPPWDRGVERSCVRRVRTGSRPLRGRSTEGRWALNPVMQVRSLPPDPRGVHVTPCSLTTRDRTMAGRTVRAARPAISFQRSRMVRQPAVDRYPQRFDSSRFRRTPDEARWSSTRLVNGRSPVRFRPRAPCLVMRLASQARCLRVETGSIPVRGAPQAAASW